VYVLRKRPELLEIVQKNPYLLTTPLKREALLKSRSYKSMMHQKELKKKKHNPGRSRMRNIRNKWQAKRLPKKERKSVGFTPITRSAKPIAYKAPKKEIPKLPVPEIHLSKRLRNKPNKEQVLRHLTIKARKKAAAFNSRKSNGNIKLDALHLREI